MLNQPFGTKSSLNIDEPTSLNIDEPSSLNIDEPTSINIDEPTSIDDPVVKVEGRHLIFYIFKLIHQWKYLANTYKCLWIVIIYFFLNKATLIYILV